MKWDKKSEHGHVHQERKWTLNKFLHDKAVDPEAATTVARLLAGGQGLRGGDPVSTPTPSQTNCCLHCLMSGRRITETLSHFLFDCPAYSNLRRKSPLSTELATHDTSLFHYHRNVWSWAQLRALRSLLCQMVAKRRAPGGHLLKRKGDAKQLVMDLWDTSE